MPSREDPVKIETKHGVGAAALSGWHLDRCHLPHLTNVVHMYSKTWTLKDWWRWGTIRARAVTCTINMHVV